MQTQNLKINFLFSFGVVLIVFCFLAKAGYGEEMGTKRNEVLNANSLSGNQPEKKELVTTKPVPIPRDPNIASSGVSIKHSEIVPKSKEAWKPKIGNVTVSEPRPLTPNSSKGSTHSENVSARPTSYGRGGPMPRLIKDLTAESAATATIKTDSGMVVSSRSSSLAAPSLSNKPGSDEEKAKTKGAFWFMKNRKTISN